MLISILQTDPPLYVMILLGMIISIVLHELAHGYVAIKLGDDTPIRLNRMTFNPMVNLGPFSLILLAIAGIGWGSMPCNVSNLRGKFGEAWVALAGPATNIAIFIIFTIALTLLLAFHQLHPDSTFPFFRALQFASLMAILNLYLAFFNLLPVIPLDGCRALMGFDSNFRSFVERSVNFQQFGFMAAFGICFLLDKANFGPASLSAQFVFLIANVFSKIIYLMLA